MIGSIAVSSRAAAASSSSALTRPSMSWRSASTSTRRPSSRAVALVTGPIDTTRALAGKPVAAAERLDEVPHGRGAREGHVVGVRDRAPLPPRRAPRARSRRAPRRRPSAPGLARARRAARRAPPPRARSARACRSTPRSTSSAASDSAIERSGTTSARSAVAREGGRRARPDRGDRRAGERARVVPAAASASISRSAPFGLVRQTTS